MAFRIARYILLGLSICLIFLAFYLFTSAVYRQTSNEVVIQEPGKRSLGPPQSVAPEARKDLEFAWLSQAAYRRMPDNKSSRTGSCPTAESVLQKVGWLRWEDFPGDGLQKKIAKSNLRVEVWSNRSNNEVAIAFGGTVASSGKDWKSNFRWFIPRHDDEYTEIVKEFGPSFVEEFLRRRRDPGWAFLTHASVFATGHSLGGGLAQEFAYALPINPDVPRVRQVFAFDPSPVTGFYSLDAATRNTNARDLKIDRIYERGEILAILRSLTNFFYPPSGRSPAIRHVRYNLFSRQPIAGHSMLDLACKLSEVSEIPSVAGGK